MLFLLIVEIPDPEFRQLVRTLVESQWREPAVVVHLEDIKPEFKIPGRRKDGTFKGKRLIRRFFWNLIRIPIDVVVSAFFSVMGGELVHFGAREGWVRGPENAQAIGLVEAAKSAETAWLACSPSHVAVLDTGPSYAKAADSPQPKILWHAASPYAPRFDRANHLLTWPDGSEYSYHLSVKEWHFERGKRMI